jgi:ssDNA-binding replication factor A large subunit
MDLLQDQVTDLALKVDSMRQTIEHLSSQTTKVLSELKLQGRENAESSQLDANVSANVGWYSQQRSKLDEQTAHKDVLVDVRFPETEQQSGDRFLSPEVQVQRLTAQLTAAYNRIAALEEQLLSKRNASKN